MRENLIIKKVLSIEALLKAVDTKGADLLLADNEKLKAEVLRMKKENAILKGQVTKLENKKKEVK